MNLIITAGIVGAFFIWLDRPRTAHGWRMLGCATAIITIAVAAVTKC